MFKLTKNRCKIICLCFSSELLFVMITLFLKYCYQLNKISEPNVFNIGKVAANFSAYMEGGRFTQVKVPSTISHKSLKESLIEPDILMWDYAKFENPSQLHALWQALHAFEHKVLILLTFISQYGK